MRKLPNWIERLQLILDRVDTHSEYGVAKFSSLNDFDDFREIVQALYGRAIEKAGSYPVIEQN
jgi:hypothetical protein